MKCTNIRENTRLHKGYAEPRLRETQWVLHRRKPLLRGRDDEAGVNTVCIGKDLSMQGPIRVHAYCGGKGGERKDRAVWRFAPKGNGMRRHRVVVIPLHGLLGMNRNRVVYEAHHRQC